jgi:hypothetical protein
MAVTRYLNADPVDLGNGTKAGVPRIQNISYRVYVYICGYLFVSTHISYFIYHLSCEYIYIYQRYIYVHMCMCICIYTHIHIHVNTCVCVCICKVYICTQVEDVSRTILYRYVTF